MSLSFKVRSALRRRRWRRYWIAQENANHVAYFQALAAEWRGRDTTGT